MSTESKEQNIILRELHKIMSNRKLREHSIKKMREESGKKNLYDLKVNKHNKKNKIKSIPKLYHI